MSLCGALLELIHYLANEDGGFSLNSYSVNFPLPQLTSTGGALAVPPARRPCERPVAAFCG